MITTVDRKLTAEDRCDSCSAQAKIVFTFLNGELMFCGHHAKKQKEELVKQSVGIYDPDNVLI